MKCQHCGKTENVKKCTGCGRMACDECNHGRGLCSNCGHPRK